MTSPGLLNLIFGLIFVFCSCNKSEQSLSSSSKLIIEKCDQQKLQQEFELLQTNENVPDSSWLNFSRKMANLDCRLNRDSMLLAIADVFHLKGNESVYIDYNNARDYFLAALMLRRTFYEDSLHLDLIRLYSNIALSYSWEGNYPLALKYFDSTLVEKPEFKVFPDIYNHTKIGECYRFSGDYLKALQHFNQAWATVNQYLNGELEKNEVAWYKACLFIGDLVNNIAYCYQDKKDYDQAIKVLSEGQIILRQISHPADSGMRLANNVMAMANIYLEYSRQLKSGEMKLAKSNQALTHYKLANRYYLELKDTQNMQACYRNAGACLFDQKRYMEAKQTFGQAIQLSSASPKIFSKENTIGILSNLGACYSKMDLQEKALSYFEMAIAKMKGEINEDPGLPTAFEMSKDFNTSLYLLGNLGRVHLLLAQNDKSHFKKSQAAYDSLAVLLNYVRGNLMSDQAKLSLAEQSRFWIPDAVKDMSRLYFMSGDNQFKLKALQMSEQGKSFALIEASRLKNASSLLSETLQKKQNELTQLQIKANTDPSLADELERETVHFLNDVKTQAPSYYNLKYKGSDIDLVTIQKECIDSNQAILEYFVQDSSLYLFAITKQSFILDTQLLAKSELQHLVYQFQSNLNPVNSEGILDQDKVQKFCSASAALYELLVGRIKDSIALPERLIIIPDAMLNNLSFDALLNMKDDKKQDIPAHVKAQNFLVQQHSISYCFSISMLQEMQTHTDRKTESRLKLFAPEFQKNSTLLPYMVYQDEEIKRISEQVSSAEMEPKGTKENFIIASQHHSYVHVSTHGFAANDPGSSFIAFEQKSATPDSSQFLFLNELYYHPMNVELMTLTACETAVGQLSEGEGNLSFARGFAYAGVKSFITTLWKIQTNGASQIMPGFYDKFFNEGLPKDLALTQSKRQYLNAGKAIYPDDWAGLILVGSTTPVQSSGSDPKLIIYALSCLLFALLLWKLISGRSSGK